MSPSRVGGGRERWQVGVSAGRKAPGWGRQSAASSDCLPLARTELSDHLDAMDSNLDSLQTMLTSHGFSVDTSTLLDVSPGPAPPRPPRPQARPDRPPFPAVVQPFGDSA